MREDREAGEKPHLCRIVRRSDHDADTLALELFTPQRSQQTNAKHDRIQFAAVHAKASRAIAIKRRWVSRML